MLCHCFRKSPFSIRFCHPHASNKSLINLYFGDSAVFFKNLCFRSVLVRRRVNGRPNRVKMSLFSNKNDRNEYVYRSPRFSSHQVRLSSFQGDPTRIPFGGTSVGKDITQLRISDYIVKENSRFEPSQ